jgi:radical SAM protein with 4Fe4S-binding SPASM domain
MKVSLITSGFACDEERFEKLHKYEVHTAISIDGNRESNEIMRLKGRCGICEYREICGGCRTRAEYYTGDLFESDPACNYIPKVLQEDPKAIEEMRKNAPKKQ